MRRFIAFPIAVSAMLVAAAPALAGGIAVPIDQVRMVTFKKPVATVYVGNPSIADVTVIDSRRVFVLGKQFGTTNVVALDGAGHETANDAVTVYGQSADVVTLNRGSAQYTYSCTTGRCEAAPIPGDIKKPYYEPVMGENQNRQSAGSKAAVASNPQ